ncbi:CPBP family intramembrane glutamic endopeptidase [Lactococcus formosensis]|uniref:CPBP family intramembrane metalloprotease n=2 Tax=Lactococcus formosensis TaxID=1281486 RepID=A0A9Q8Y1G5_9LACT|nr:CPBP family intramembrane glutamic endopeptidase [Lactococcus formosensis]MCH1722475.1 CPBP family intramembrane metalloprotease [Lactococcus formosensis]MCO7181402.1 CPBP family intramembrane metalloprotease [Lactococcus formosensis]MDG6114314.1 CPBP family intramembrane metalloprotease [Lactococcus formosensis]MDG6116423.1 CPBP family intramembrane metalloprotease [Lactococcus formosensis]MDG6122608.1 CPBP family intramembrane metalloprotease [Lactococcus formosensis]
MNFLRDNKREFIVLTIYILFVPFQLGMIPLLFLSEMTNTNWVESDFINLAVGISVPAFLALLLFRRELAESFSYFKTHSALKILSLPLWMAIMLFVETLAQHFYGSGLNPENQEFLTEISNHVPTLVTLLVLGILGPIIEEVIFRHILLNRLSHYTGIIFAVIFSTTLFAVMHMQQPMDFILYAPGSLLLAIAYLSSHRSLVFVIFLHMLNNILGLLG